MNILRRLFRRKPRTLSSVAAYAQWATSYSAHAHNSLMTIEQDAMLKLLPDLHNKVVLDLACGTGRYGLIAQEQNAAQVYGFDNSLAMLEAAALSTVALATMQAIPLAKNTMDVIVCGLALGHLPDIEKSMCEIGRVLKPEGVVLISDFHPYQYLNGARRTFHGADGKVYEVEHYVHLMAEYHRLAMQAGLSLTGILEPTYEAMPVVLVMRFEKMMG